VRLQPLQARGADAAFGHVDDAQQPLRVVGIDERREVRDRVADLGALVELGAADDLVADGVAAELLLEHARLGVGAVQHRDLVGPVRPFGAGLALEQLLHLAGHELRLGALVVDLHDLDARALPSRRPQVLALALAVVGDHGVGDVEDRLRAAVVLLQANDLGIGVVALELEDVADVGATPRVDALVVVADHGEIAVLAGQEIGEAVLRVVGVLVLVDEHEAERLLVMPEALGEALEQLHRLHEEVVEVHGVHLGVTLLVERVHVGRGLREPPPDTLAEFLRADELVLGVADLPRQGLRREALGVEVELLETALDEPAAVVLVMDRERALVADALGFAAQQARAHAVEGADPHGARDRSHEAADALLHLAGGLVGEGDGHHLVGPHAVNLDEVGHAVREHAGLARPGAGEDEQRALEVGDGGALLFVEAGEERVVRRSRTHSFAGRAAPAPGLAAGRLLAGGAHQPTPPPTRRLMTRAMTPAAARRSPDSQRRSREMAPRKTPRKKSSTRPTPTAAK